MIKAGLLSVTQSIGAWLIGGGTDEGVNQIVGNLTVSRPPPHLLFVSLASSCLLLSPSSPP